MSKFVFENGQGNLYKLQLNDVLQIQMKSGDDRLVLLFMLPYNKSEGGLVLMGFGLDGSAEEFFIKDIVSIKIMARDAEVLFTFLESVTKKVSELNKEAEKISQKLDILHKLVKDFKLSNPRL